MIREVTAVLSRSKAILYIQTLPVQVTRMCQNIEDAVTVECGGVILGENPPKTTTTTVTTKTNNHLLSNTQILGNMAIIVYLYMGNFIL